ncbi:DinB family protein [Echinicola sp. 20G]|uniref:DinB family protein n=1 Tax=Echinicola sp. 20G TaxID=2781961 RepID=UPI001910C10B|nr:DinB family protein [Echinicola sp. 20G]
METFFEELFTYTNHYNQKVIEVLVKNDTKDLSKSIKLFSHILNAHSLWNAKINHLSPPCKPWDLQEIKNFNSLNRRNFESSLSIIKERPMDELIKYRLGNGQELQNNVQDMLFQIINHSTYHRAQIASDFRENGLDPIMTEYIVYKMPHPL